jgi:hypothetical protein
VVWSQHYVNYVHIHAHVHTYTNICSVMHNLWNTYLRLNYVNYYSLTAYAYFTPIIQQCKIHTCRCIHCSSITDDKTVSSARFSKSKKRVFNLQHCFQQIFLKLVSWGREKYFNIHIHNSWKLKVFLCSTKQSLAVFHILHPQHQTRVYH